MDVGGRSVARPPAPRPDHVGAADRWLTAGGPVLLRMPLRPHGPHPAPADPVARLRHLAGDRLLVEAVRVASRPLSSAWQRALDPDRPPPAERDLWRTLTAVVAYQQRAGSRATPFGLFAGVAVARFTDRAQARVGHRHRTCTRPDRRWLRDVLARVEPDLVEVLWLRTDDGWSTVGDRMVSPSTSDGETSVRRTPLVAAVLARATVPVVGRDLLDRVGADVPEVPRDRLVTFVNRLIALGLLVTDLHPTSGCVDPLEHAIGCVTRRPELPCGPALRQVRDRIAGYDAGRSSLADVYLSMDALQPADRPVYVDTAVDATVGLPYTVGQEATNAAQALWRMSPATRGSARLRGYHARFLERYGVGRLVPVPELLSPDRGLGPPEDTTPAAGQVDGPDRAAQLARLAATTAREVVLDEATVAALDRGDPGPSGRPTSLELHARLLAPSLAALDAGQFRLVVAPDLGTHPVGTSFARFAALLGSGLDGLPVDGSATVAYRPLSARAENVAAAPPWLPHRIPVAAPIPAPGDLPLDRLAVACDADRLYLVSRDDGRPVRPVVFDLLTCDVAPVAVRFLRLLAREGVRPMRPWDWGPSAHAPYLPRVRLGRTVLASATWTAHDLADAARGPETAWPAAVQRWRDRRGIPATVVLADRDQRIPVDLDDPVHRRILLARVRRGAFAVTEVPAGEEYRDGWLTGPDGAHAGEVVIALTRTPPAVVVAPPAARVRTGDPVARPGGRWLYAKVYAAAARHDDILGTHLPELPLDRVDRWFFVRYHDPEPHLRLRFHGDPTDLWGRLLPALHDWTGRLAATGLAGRLVIDSYDPELERYGGVDAMAAAERVFQRDSETALALLPLDRRIFGALSLVDLLSDFDPHRLLAPWGAAPQRRAEYRTARGPLETAVVPAAVRQAWDRRRAALDAYRGRLGDAAAVDGIALSLAHLHANRVFGTDRGAEAAALGLAWNIGRGRAARGRHDSTVAAP